MKELIYIVAEAEKTMFVETNLTKSDISFVKGDQYAMVTEL